MKNIYLVVGILIFSFSNLKAITVTWIGGTDYFWHNPANWDIGIVPSATDLVILPSYPSTVRIQSDSIAFAQSIELYGSNFTIKSGAVLNIDGAVGNGIYLYEGAIWNYGTVNISNTGLRGIYVGDYIPNFNQEESSLKFNIKGKEKELLSKLLIFENPFFNYSTVNILTGIGTDGIFTKAGAFVNYDCSVLNINYKINNPGSFVNEGIIYQNYSGINTSVYPLKNYYVIEDLQNSFSGVPITNNGFKAVPLTGTFTVGTPRTPILIGLGTGITITNNEFYTDSLLTTSAGPYDKPTNTWTPNANAEGLDRFFMEFDNGSCTEIMEINLETAVQGVLPIDLISFEAKNNKNGVELSWQTSFESNNYGFEIQRLTEGKEWLNIGFVGGNEDSNSVQEYSFIDENPLQGTNYYRLKQLDFDGQYEFSRSVSLNFEDIGLSFYPNPVIDKISINTSSDIELEIYNNLGELIINELLRKGTHFLNVSNFESGIYYLKSVGGETFKFIKK